MSEVQLQPVVSSPAEIYEECFVPAILRGWAQKLADVADVRPGQCVLDVACGTGIVGRTIAERLGRDFRVEGIDLSEDMLAVAKRAAPEIRWRQARAESLPYEANSFDAVVSQFGLMFFEDRVAAVREMVRVLVPGGQLTVAVWDSLENFQGYAQLAALFRRHLGDEAGEAILSPFVLGDRDKLAGIFTEAGVPQAEITTFQGTARFPSLESWLLRELEGWLGTDGESHERFQDLLADAQSELDRFVAADGTLLLQAQAHLVTARKH